MEKNYAKTRKSVENGQKYRRKSHFASKNGDFNTRFAFFSYLCGQQKQNGMDKEGLRKEFEAIRQDRQQYDRDRILDSWEATVLFRNRELEHRVDKLEEKIFSQNVTNNVLILTVGFFIGVLLCHIFG